MRRRLAFPFMLMPIAAGATTYSVGASRVYSSPCVLVASVSLGAGDIVEVDPGTYTDACELDASGTVLAPITLRGLPGPMPVFDATGVDLSGVGSIPRAIFQFTGGSFWVVQHLELENASNTSANGAAFRVTGGAHDILIEDVSIHDCQDGLMSDGVATVTVQASDIFHNGAGDGFSHNFYMQGDSTTLIGNHIHDSNGGQNVKLRSRYAAVLFNRIENAGNYELDLIQGPLTSDANANAVLIGNVIVRPATSGNDSQVILFGTDDTTQLARNGSLYAVNNTIVLQNSKNRLFHAVQPVSGSQIFFENNIVVATTTGTALVADATTGGVLTGAHNWFSADIALSGTLTQTLSGADPGFASTTDYHLVASSPAVGQGALDAAYEDGTGTAQSAIPTEEFLAPEGTTPRPNATGLDLGAFEHAASDGGTDGGSDAGGLDAGQTPTDAGSPTSDGGVAVGSGVSASCGCSATSETSFLNILLVAAFLRAAPRHREQTPSLGTREANGSGETAERVATQMPSVGTSQPAART
jgi:hypothetical protein